MFDKLWEIVQAIWEFLIPVVVLYPFEKGVLCRLGAFKRELEPGLHWVIPFHIDQVFNEHITPRTEHLTGLATTTKDGQSVGFDAVITWKISSIKRALLEVTDLKDAIADTCAGQIGTTLAEATWDAIRSGEVVENLTEVVRKRGWRWGVEILNVQLSGVARVRNFRVTGSSQTHTVHLTPSGL
jgi:regulator of protease activity HflC (stomatin/prohibitin superfamily)